MSNKFIWVLIREDLEYNDFLCLGAMTDSNRAYSIQEYLNKR